MSRAVPSSHRRQAATAQPHPVGLAPWRLAAERSSHTLPGVTLPGVTLPGVRWGCSCDGQRLFALLQAPGRVGQRLIDVGRLERGDAKQGRS